jgi:D-arabinose 1-dehydrogenase-like Zn-dependent alcohol dehydrogenase
MCDHRDEVGVRDGRPGALAEQIAVFARSLHALPDSLDPVLGALVEPGGNSLRAAQAAALAPGDRALVLPGRRTVAAVIACAAGAGRYLCSRNPRHAEPAVYSRRLRTPPLAFAGLTPQCHTCRRCL